MTWNGRTEGHSDDATEGPSDGRVALHGVSPSSHVAASSTTVRPFRLNVGAAAATVGSAATAPASTHPLRKVDDWYPIGVLSDEVSVAGLRCGHLAFDLDEYAEWAECGWCSE